MDSLHTLAFLAFFDIILLISLAHNYRKLRYRFLKFGILALAVEVGVQLMGYSGLLHAMPTLDFAFQSLLRIVYVGLLLVCVTDLTGQVFPRRGYYSAAAGLVGALAYACLAPAITPLMATLVETPASLLLLYVVFLLIRYRSNDSMGTSWLAVLVAIHVALKMSLPFVGQGSLAAGQVQFLDSLVLLLVGVALVMITSEWTIRDLVSKDERIEEYAEDRKRLELQFSHAQKLESLGVLAGGIAHDFNNMLTSILGYASLAMKKLPNDSEIRKDLYMVMSGARQAVDLTSQMLIYAGKGALEFESVDISKVADNMSSLIHSIVPRKIQLVQRLARDLPTLRGDKVQLGQVLMNLIANGVDAIEDQAGTIEITTGIAEVDDSLLRECFFSDGREPGAYLFLRVKDSGIGMSGDQVERIFDPFYSEKKTNKGLGLSSLSGIVRQHKGFIRVRSSMGEGSEFIVYFPVVAFQESLSRPRFQTRSHDQIKGDVLLADDDPRIRSLMASILEGEYFRLTSAEDGKEALQIFEESGGNFDLLVLDCTMPKLSGPEVYRKIRAGGSRIPVVLVSGYHQEQVIANISNDPNAFFVKKPFNVDEFLEEIMTAIKTNQSA